MVAPRFARFTVPVLISACAAGAACGGKGAPGSLKSADPVVQAEPVPDEERGPHSNGCAAVRPPRLAGAGRHEASSAIAVATLDDRDVVLLADEDDRALRVLDAHSLELVGKTDLHGAPKNVLVLADGRLAVTLRDAGRLAILEPREGSGTDFEERCELEVPPEPWGIAEAGDHVLVTSAFGAAMTVFKGKDLELADQMKLPREPRSVLVDPSGEVAYVSHAVGGVVSAIDLGKPSRLSKISVKAGSRQSSSGGLVPREATQGYALAGVVVNGPKGGDEEWHLLAPNTSVDPGAAVDGISSSGYGADIPVAPAISVIDPKTRSSLTDDVRFGETDCLLPRAAVARSWSVFVACMDSDSIVEYDAQIDSPTRFRARSIKVPRGPSAIAFDAKARELYVWSELARDLSSVHVDSNDADGKPTDVLTSVHVAPRAPVEGDAAVIARGRDLFHSSRDKRIAQARACASCHPEGRDDGVVWTSPDGPRQTPMLAGRLADSAPYGWFGENPTVKDHLVKTFARLGGSGMSGAGDAKDFDALVAYVMSLQAPPSTPPKDAALADRGHALFGADGCGSCHESGSTDGHTHDVGSGAGAERKQAFDTPSLRGVRGSAPYFHDGRYPTLEALLSAKDNKMLGDRELSPDDRDAIRAYLDTL